MMDCHDSPASWAPVTTSLGSKMVIRGTGSSMAYRMGRNCPRKKPVQKEEACTRRADADNGFTASHCGLSGTGFLNEAPGRHAVCSNTWIDRAGKRGGLGKRLVTRSKCKASPTQARRVTSTLPPWSG